MVIPGQQNSYSDGRLPMAEMSCELVKIYIYIYISIMMVYLYSLTEFITFLDYFIDFLL